MISKKKVGNDSTFVFNGIKYGVIDENFIYDIDNGIGYLTIKNSDGRIKKMCRAFTIVQDKKRKRSNTKIVRGYNEYGTRRAIQNLWYWLELYEDGR